VGDPTLKARVHEEMTAALRAGDKLRLGALRMLSAAITNREKEVLHELDDDEVRAVAAREVKRRTESMEAFEAANRPELADKERAEREVLQPFAPEQLSEAEIDALIDAAITSSSASSMSDMGKVMGAVMATAKGKADGSVVQGKVRDRLAGS
jgi:uncharacterized protein YqeY